MGGGRRGEEREGLNDREARSSGGFEELDTVAGCNEAFNVIEYRGISWYSGVIVIQIDA